jgi:hypothetical protein
MHGTLKKWLALKISGGSLADRLDENGVRRVVIYGVRGLGEMVCSDLGNSNVRISCFADKRHGDYPAGNNGVDVVSIGRLREIITDEYVLITPEFYFRQIFEELTAAGINAERIISLSMLL